ncbi:hypothetical protein NF867_16375 [Solitalea sp. MAHUQ-68]|uniref:Uncharacterized protein n=1 Tax=Solitalea agri TaxID=2953739 RepID=A0A9X2F5A5_9SPHI|nr:hypothetical protein [Solitalea agri]MCO4294439.1 hypothetical protein [Solitalea agri]
MIKLISEKDLKKVVEIENQLLLRNNTFPNKLVKKRFKHNIFFSEGFLFTSEFFDLLCQNSLNDNCFLVLTNNTKDEVFRFDLSTIKTSQEWNDFFKGKFHENIYSLDFLYFHFSTNIFLYGKNENWAYYHSPDNPNVLFLNFSLELSETLKSKVIPAMSIYDEIGCCYDEKEEKRLKNLFKEHYL